MPHAASDRAHSGDRRRPSEPRSSGAHGGGGEGAAALPRSRSRKVAAAGSAGGSRGGGSGGSAHASPPAASAAELAQLFDAEKNAEPWMFKTKMCKRWVATGDCSYADTCWFVRGRPPAARAWRAICRARTGQSPHSVD
jgi:hypothetical protein